MMSRAGENHTFSFFSLHDFQVPVPLWHLGAAHFPGNHLRSHSSQRQPYLNLTPATGLKRTGWKSLPVNGGKKHIVFSLWRYYIKIKLLSEFSKSILNFFTTLYEENSKFLSAVVSLFCYPALFSLTNQKPYYSWYWINLEWHYHTKIEQLNMKR